MLGYLDYTAAYSTTALTNLPWAIAKTSAVVAAKTTIFTARTGYDLLLDTIRVSHNYFFPEEGATKSVKPASEVQSVNVENSEEELGFFGNAQQFVSDAWNYKDSTYFGQVANELSDANEPLFKAVADVLSLPVCVASVLLEQASIEAKKIHAAAKNDGNNAYDLAIAEAEQHKQIYLESWDLLGGEEIDLAKELGNEIKLHDDKPLPSTETDSDFSFSNMASNVLESFVSWWNQEKEEDTDISSLLDELGGILADFAGIADMQEEISGILAGDISGTDVDDWLF